ncbi:hypothetical protein PAPYR_8801 [Paratrimastix pyriformis]|uniref:Uncharacterized protein n=1 Tax=Paratrimastix pyriformis TaxID=342808 RepID=A0ABQ8UFJ5_9EUKA|nr:hypothetical protein PAPYR_8801 [Paratrimastix pyriformis]
MQPEEQTAQTDLAEVADVNEATLPRKYQKRNIVVTASDPVERRREYKKQYSETVKEKPTHRNKRRNIVLTETDPVKREAEYRRKYKELIKREQAMEAPIQFTTVEELANALYTCRVEAIDVPQEAWSLVTHQLAQAVFDHVLDQRRGTLQPAAD